MSRTLIKPLGLIWATALVLVASGCGSPGAGDQPAKEEIQKEIDKMSPPATGPSNPS